MTSDSIIFAGVDISSGRKPVTFAALDEDLRILTIHKWTLPESVLCLQEYEAITLAIHSSSSVLADFKKELAQAGFKQASWNSSRRWMETDAHDGYRVLCERKLLSQRSVEGRIQRALILYDERLQIPDPMDFFEEITRHKLIQGILPFENTYSAHELDALMASYVAWAFANEPRRVRMAKNKAILLKDTEE